MSLSSARWRPVVLALCVLVLTVAVRAFNLSRPNVLEFDEKFYVISARNMLAHEEDNNMAQPPLGKLMISTSMKTWWWIENAFLDGHDNDTNCIAWRAGSMVMGSACVIMVFFLGRAMFGDAVGVVAAFLMSIDFLHVVMSRIAMLDIYQAFFLLYASYAVWEYINEEEGDRRWLAPIFVALGCATAVKWSGVFTACSLLVAVVALKPNPPAWTDRLRREAVHAVLGMCVIVLIYALCYVPTLRMHQWKVGEVLRSITMQQGRMVTLRMPGKPGGRTHGRGLVQRYLSPWWQWPTLLRPVWYQFTRVPHPVFSIYQWFGGDTASVGDLYGPRLPMSLTVGPADDPASELPVDKGWVLGIIAMGSPWVWWSFLLVLLGLLGWAGAHREQLSQQPWTQEGKAVALLVIVYLGQLLIWIPVKGFLYYMLYEVPLMCLILGWALQRLSRLPYGRWLAGGWLAMALLFFVAYYPLLIAYPIPMPMFWKLMWMHRHWI